MNPQHQRRPLPYEVVDITQRSIPVHCCQSTSCITITASPTHPLPLAWAKLLPCGCALCRECLSRVITNNGYTCVGCSMRADQFGPLDLQVNNMFRDFKSALSTNTRQNQYNHHHPGSHSATPSVQNTPDLSMSSIASSSAAASPEIPFYPPLYTHDHSRINQYDTPYLSQKDQFYKQEQAPLQKQYREYPPLPQQMGHQQQIQQMQHLPSPSMHPIQMHSNQAVLAPPCLSALPAVQGITYPSLRKRQSSIESTNKGGDRHQIPSSSSSSSHQSSYQAMQPLKEQHHHERRQSYADVANAQTNIIQLLSAEVKGGENAAMVGLGLSGLPGNLYNRAEERQDSHTTPVTGGIGRDAHVQQAARENAAQRKREEGRNELNKETEDAQMMKSTADTASEARYHTLKPFSPGIQSSTSHTLPSRTGLSASMQEETPAETIPDGGEEEELEKATLLDRVVEVPHVDQADQEHKPEFIAAQHESIVVQLGKRREEGSSASSAAPLGTATTAGTASSISQEPEVKIAGPSPRPTTNDTSQSFMPMVSGQEQPPPPSPPSAAARTHSQTSSNPSATRPNKTDSPVQHPHNRSPKAYSSAFSSLNKRRPSISSSPPTHQAPAQRLPLASRFKQETSMKQTHTRQTSPRIHNQDCSRQFSTSSSSSTEKPIFEQFRRPSTSSMLSHAPGDNPKPTHYVPYEELAKGRWGLDPWTDRGRSRVDDNEAVKPSDTNAVDCVKAYSWPVLKICGLSYHTTVADIISFLPSGSLPPSSEHVQPIHIFTDFHSPDPAFRNKTLPHAYIECSSPASALSLLSLSKEGNLPTLAGRTVYIRASTQKDLISDLWSSFLKYEGSTRPIGYMHKLDARRDHLPFFEEEDRGLMEEMFEPYPPSSASPVLEKPASNPDNPDSIMKTEEEGEDTDERAMKRRFIVYPRERPFTRLTSLLTKLPIHKAGLVDRATLDRLYGCLSNAITCIANGTEGLHHARDICEGLIKAGQSCTGFSDKQQLVLEYAWKSIADMDISNLPSPAARIDFSRPYPPSYHNESQYGNKVRDRGTTYAPAYRTRSKTTNPAFSETYPRRYSHERSSTTYEAVVPHYKSAYPYKEYNAPEHRRIQSSSSAFSNTRTRQASLAAYSRASNAPVTQYTSQVSILSSDKSPRTVQREVLKSYTNHIRGDSNASNASTATIKTSSSSSMPEPGKYKVPPRLARKVKGDRDKAGEA